MELRSLKNFRFPEGKKSALTGLSQSGAALACAQIFSQNPKPLLWVVPTIDQAELAFHDLSFFLSLTYPQNAPTISLLPCWEISPYKKISPSLSSRHQRLQTLHRISQANENTIIISPIQALSQASSSLEYFQKSTIRLSPQLKIDPLALEQKLFGLGYQKSDPVEDVGTFARRGGILDVFSPAHEWPLRIEFFDDTIENVRPYNPATQRSLTELKEKEFFIIPAREFAAGSESLFQARSNIKDWADEHDIPKAQRDRISELLQKGILANEFDYLLPFFQKTPAFPLEFFPKNTLVLSSEPQSTQLSLDGFIDEQESLFSKGLEGHEIMAPPSALWKKFTALSVDLAPFTQINISTIAWHNDITALQIRQEPNPKFFIPMKENAKGKRSVNLDHLAETIQRILSVGEQIYFIANSQAQLDRFAFLLSQRNIASEQTVTITAPSEPAVVRLLLGTITSGFRLPEEKLIFISEDEIFGQKTHLKRSKPSASERALSATTLDHLQPGDLIVHKDHGIGRYRGLTKLTANFVTNDFVFIEYAGADKLYLPIYRLENIQKYLGAGGAGPSTLDKLGSQQFSKTKEKVKEAVKDIAANLLKIYAERASRESYAFSEPDEVFREFETSFPYDETPDQLKAIQETIGDMCRAKPMDRLVCGDVGFGKTEVALRAAFKACQDGKQVALLVPTTILAEQHYRTFSKRMQDHGVSVGCLSRFRSPKEQKQILQQLSEGKLDVVIGTHRLLSKDVKIKDLGLLIIDEEQRFGVEHKEKLKQFKATTDILTLTATPIPRTLHLSLMGMRDISIITTPPMDRMSIRTHLAIFDLDLIKSAIAAELSRGGQVYFIHNRVQTIPTIHRQLKEILPEARIAVGHGQMPEGELEKVMQGFYNGEFDILLATTIIENGLDIANANTIIVNRADTFGLSQLYQIRGRVGRSQVRAQAYFLVPEDRDITDDAKERLRVLQRFVELGSGFAVASHDLELRGGGDILGDAQSGHIADVGYDLYLELLQEEILRLKGEEQSKSEDVEISAPFPAFLPETYVPDMRSRLSLYKALSDLQSEEAIDKAEQELRDRYGPLPPETQELLFLLKTKLLLRRFGFRSLSCSPTVLSLQAGKQPLLDPQKVLLLIASQPKRYTLTPEQKFLLRGQYTSLHSCYDDMRNTLTQLLSR